MELTNGLQRLETNLVAQMRAAFEELRRQNKVRGVYRRTYNELNQLTQRELDDLGLARADLARVARDAADAS